ncbi:universal stress protein [Umezawaea tangerina]|uniref:Nucleotide-binding universal stress UspA family protein n=1 Tax=Umezawaea tangerina TaxID=84725 RepID=A0A2T0SWS3_9PSEU|nr:universal stress protein [Umezawaea tangerina]PRY37871.1 nucleotide-binding universal stress UspA family protein [Umezawaea tangerina]
MDVVVWVVEGTWRACVRAARTLTPPDANLVLLHVTASDVPGAAHGAFAGLLGRGHPEHDPGHQVEELAEAAAEHLLRVAAEELGRPATTVNRHGRPEGEVIAAVDGADLLVVARDGDRSRLGPKSLGPATRFVVDHAPCPVLLVWPEQAPDLTSIPPPPPHR